MKKSAYLSILGASVCASLAAMGCGLVDTPCLTDSDCDAPREKCDASSMTCVKNSSYKPSSGQACRSVSECPDSRNYDCLSTGCQPKTCRNDTECRQRNDSTWVCQNSACVRGTPEPDPQVEFTLMLNANTANNLSSLWRAYLDPTKGAFEDSLILLLCAPDDPKCENPVVKRKLTEADGYTQALQANHGPTIKLSGLSNGQYKMMIVADSKVSAKIEETWNVANPNDASWGGVANDTDLLLADETDTLSPKTVDVEIADGTTAKLGTLKLGYFYQHDLSPHPEGENGVLAVATGSGVRFIDLNTYEQIPTQENGKIYEFKPYNEKGFVDTSKICAMTKGYDLDGNANLVWVITCDGKAYAFNIRTRKQVGRHHVNVGSPAPGMALAHYVDGKNYLFVQNYAGPENGGLTTKNYNRLWSGNVNNVLLGAGDVTLAENKEVTAHDKGLLSEFGAYKLAAYRRALFVQIYHTDQLKNRAEIKCDADHVCVYMYYIDEETGLLRAYKAEEARKDLGMVDHIDAGPRKADATSEEGETLKCNTTTQTMQPKIAVAEYGDNAYLFVPRCLDTFVFRIDKNNAAKKHAFEINDAENLDDRLSGSPLGNILDYASVDYKNPKAPMPHYLFGQYLAGFYQSPDGKTLWAVPNDKSLVMLHAYLNETKTRVTHNRLAAFPIDMTTKAPELVEEWNETDVDNFYGLVREDSLSKYKTPYIDPGLDLTAFYMKQHVLDYYPSINGALSSLMYNGAKVAVGKNTLWLIGHADADGKSSVGVFGDIAMYDLKSQKAVLNPQYKDEPFYQIFKYGGGAEQAFGYHLSDSQSIVAIALEYFDLDALKDVTDHHTDLDITVIN